MIQLNLLPDLKKEFIRAQKVKALVITVSVFTTLGAIAVSGLLFGYVTFVQQFQIGLASDDISHKLQQLKAIPDVDKYVTVQNQLAALPQLHDSKGLYSRLFDFLNVLNPASPNNVALTDLQIITADQTVIFTGTTTSFESLNVFVDTLKNAQISYKIEGQGDAVTENMFDQATVQTADLIRSGTGAKVSFTVRTTYREPVFNAKNTEMKASVPNITTTQSVTQSPKPPEQLFNGGGN